MQQIKIRFEIAMCIFVWISWDLISKSVSKAAILIAQCPEFKLGNGIFRLNPIPIHYITSETEYLYQYSVHNAVYPEVDVYVDILLRSIQHTFPAY